MSKHGGVRVKGVLLTTAVLDLMQPRRAEAVAGRSRPRPAAAWGSEMRIPSSVNSEEKTGPGYRAMHAGAAALGSRSFESTQPLDRDGLLHRVFGVTKARRS
jgi:hypothetical protein